MIERYKEFLSSCKTERECVKYIQEKLDATGFKGVGEAAACKKVYMVKMGKSLAAFKIGTQPIQDGMNILCAHIDSPRLDVKQNPVFTDANISFLNTHYYGGIKKYQWVAMPLAIHGVVCKKDGSVINVVIGETDEDPVLCISDLLPHLAQDQAQKKAADFITGEELDVIIGNNPEKENDKDAKEAILALLKEKYGIEEKDFQSAELEVVPAGKARDLGIDRSMILSYGQDDRSCAYTSFEAFMAEDCLPERTQCLLLVDKEEIGSVGATGMDSHLFENIVAELVDALGGNELTVRRCLANSNILSSDVNAAFDPHHPAEFDKDNTCYLGKGPTFCKFTGSRGKSHSNDANPEYIAKIRAALDEKNIPYQFAELGKVDHGGGGTIAMFAARYGMNTIDIGVPVMSMHAPWEITDKRDISATADLYQRFLTIQ